MIISKTPVRISLGGGGTDLASYYSKYGGFLVAAGIDKYIYITINKMFEGGLQIKYSKTETVKRIDEIEHPTVKESLKLLKISNDIEITSIADIPSNSGLGTSSSFLVGLLRALHAYKRGHISAYDVAEEACKIEIDILKEPIGKQDQYMASFGSLQSLSFNKKGNVTVKELKMSRESKELLQQNILLFYTGIKRSSSFVLKDQNNSLQDKKVDVVECMHEIKNIGLRSKKYLESGDISAFGETLDDHWKVKKKMSTKISNPFIDKCYKIGMKNGAKGGKIMGAGGGGFFMFYCENNKKNLRKALSKEGLKEMFYHFDSHGSKIIMDS